MAGHHDRPFLSLVAQALLPVLVVFSRCSCILSVFLALSLIFPLISSKARHPRCTCLTSEISLSWIVSGLLVGGKLDAKKVVSRIPNAKHLELGGAYDFVVPTRTLKFFDRATQKRVSSKDVSWQ